MTRHLRILLFLSGTLFAVWSYAFDAIESAVDQARQARLSRDYDASVAQLDAVLEKQPDHFRALYNKALAHASNGEQNKALSAFERASQLLPVQAKKDYTLYNSYGWFLLAIGQLEAADRQFSLAMEHFEELPKASQSRVLNNYGILKLQLDHLADARTLFKRAADDYDNTLARRNLGLIGALEKQSERWTVVFGGDRSAREAQSEIDKAAKAGIGSPFIVLRDGAYRSVASFADRTIAEKALEKAKEFRPDAYLVAWETWCRGDVAKNSCQTDF